MKWTWGCVPMERHVKQLKMLTFFFSVSQPYSCKEMGFLNPNFPFFGEREGAV